MYASPAGVVPPAGLLIGTSRVCWSHTENSSVAQRSIPPTTVLIRYVESAVPAGSSTLVLPVTGVDVTRTPSR